MLLRFRGNAICDVKSLTYGPDFSGTEPDILEQVITHRSEFPPRLRLAPSPGKASRDVLDNAGELRRRSIPAEGNMWSGILKGHDRFF